MNCIIAHVLRMALSVLLAQHHQVTAVDIIQEKVRKKIIFGGRLGEYKYYDMDAVVASALEMSKKELD